MKPCPHCGWSPAEKSPLQIEIEKIERWCMANGRGPFFSDEIRQTDAATYIDRAPKTLANHYEIPVRKHRGRTYYRIEDLAQFILDQN